MYSINGNKITLTRGDTLIAQVGILQDGEAYTPVEGDVVRFALKHAEMTADKSAFIDVNPIFTVTIPNDTLLLRIESEQTKALAFGKYVYDVQITFADGRVDTFIANAPLTLTPEVD